MSPLRINLLGRSTAFIEVIRAAELVALADVNILITGETGTGKELFARAIHETSPRRNKIFVTLNCPSLGETLADSLLFGHCRGAFTDAKRDHIGFVQQASDGTLFLDEVADLPLATQAKLLRFLESGEYQPLGCHNLRISATRIIAATNRDLASAVKHGTFRQDLYYRINVIPLHLPPLRERADDISFLAQTFLGELAKRYALRCPNLNADAIRCLEKYDWPGNVRELHNLCKRLLILRQGQDIYAENLPVELRGFNHVTENNEFILPNEGINFYQLEQNLIRQALSCSGGNQSRAARLLGFTRDTLLYRMKKYGLT